MRKAFHNVSYIIDEDKFIGVSLGYDYCAEHEWGIKGIRRKFGMDNTKVGIDARTITKGNVLYFENGDVAILRTEGWSEIKSFDDAIPYDFKNKSLTTDLLSAWCEDDFCVMGNKEYIKQLKDAFDKYDIAFAKISDHEAFGGTSLSILIKSNLPDEVIESLAYVDNKALDLLTYEAKIGLTKLKEEKYRSVHNSEFDETKHKYWMALSPKWINYKGENEGAKSKNKTEYDIMYWVNYGDDDVYGWFTVEQIKQWLETPNLKLRTLKEY